LEVKYSEFCGVSDLYYALVTADTISAYTAGAVTYLAPVAEIAGTPTINNITSYYDNVAAINYVVEGKTELKITVSNVDAETMATILGKTYDAATGRFYDDGVPDPPKCALGFKFRMGTGNYRYYWYLVGTFSGGAETAQTSTENVTPQPYELTFTAVSTSYEFTVGGEQMSLKRVFGDDSAAAFVGSTWFDQVQTPAAVGAPDAIALSTAEPADGELAFGATANIVLTFNNAIDSNAISVVKTDGTLVAGAATWDAAKKVYTFNPTDPLAAGADYIININGVVDIYGQALATAALNFTVAS
jgi:phi13 family phage major tail protein